ASNTGGSTRRSQASTKERSSALLPSDAERAHRGVDELVDERVVERATADEETVEDRAREEIDDDLGIGVGAEVTARDALAHDGHAAEAPCRDEAAVRVTELLVPLRLRDHGRDDATDRRVGEQVHEAAAEGTKVVRRVPG